MKSDHVSCCCYYYLFEYMHYTYIYTYDIYLHGLFALSIRFAKKVSKFLVISIPDTIYICVLKMCQLNVNNLIIMLSGNSNMGTALPKSG